MPSSPLLSSTGQPLRVLLTRPYDQSVETASWIRSLGGEPLLFPCLRVESSDDPALRRAATELANHHAVALTSVHAVRALLSLVPPGVRCPPLFVIGRKTAAEVNRLGFSVSCVLDGEPATARALSIELLRALGPPRRNQRVLFPQAAEGRDELPQLLTEAGLGVERVIAYRTVAVDPIELQPAIRLLRLEQVDLVPLGSPRTAQVLLSVLGSDMSAVLGKTLVGAIGQTTAKALRDLQVRVDVVAAEPSFENLVEKLAELKARS